MSDNESAKGHLFIRRFLVQHRAVAAAANTALTFYVNNEILTGAADAADGISPKQGYFWKIIGGDISIDITGAAATGDVQINLVDRQSGYYTSKLFHRIYAAEAINTSPDYGIPDTSGVDKVGQNGVKPTWLPEWVVKVTNATMGALCVVSWNLNLLIEEYMEEWMVRKLRERK